MAYSDVNNDEAIARAIATADQELADAELAKRLEQQDLGNSVPHPFEQASMSHYPGQRRPVASPRDTRSPSHSRVSSRTINCPNGCGLTPFQAPRAQMIKCNECNRRLQVGEQAYGCTACDYDVCDRCFQRDRSSSSTTARPPPVVPGTPISRPPPFASMRQPPPPAVEQNPMCMVPCIIGDGACVEMMIDSGAQISVISLPLAQQLNLASRIDQSHRGVAAGVGQARITGRIHHVLCTLGNVEFEMDFMVLETKEKMLLLGLDQMRKYKCIIDLEEEKLVFGGKGGVEVPMLPPAQVPRWKQDMMSQVGCPIS